MGDDGALGPEEIEAARSAPLFQTDDVLEFTLHADFNTIRRQDREQDAEERPARVQLAADGSELKIQTRGNWRLNSRNCAFPPLWLDYGQIFDHFTEKREEMLAVIRNFGGLEEDRRDRVIDYWEDFFEMAADEGDQEDILRDCRKMPG